MLIAGGRSLNIFCCTTPEFVQVKNYFSEFWVFYGACDSISDTFTALKVAW